MVGPGLHVEAVAAGCLAAALYPLTRFVPASRALSAIVERAFSINGLGSYLVKAAGTKDIAVVQGISMVIVTAFVVINLLVDVCYLILDPRIRAMGERT